MSFILLPKVILLLINSFIAFSELSSVNGKSSCAFLINQVINNEAIKIIITRTINRTIVNNPALVIPNILVNTGNSNSGIFEKTSSQGKGED